MLVENEEFATAALKTTPIKTTPLKMTPSKKTPSKMTEPKSRKRLFAESEDSLSGMCVNLLKCFLLFIQYE